VQATTHSRIPPCSCASARNSRGDGPARDLQELAKRTLMQTRGRSISPWRRTSVRIGVAVAPGRHRPARPKALARFLASRASRSVKPEQLADVGGNSSHPRRLRAPRSQAPARMGVRRRRLNIPRGGGPIFGTSPGYSSRARPRGESGNYRRTSSDVEAQRNRKDDRASRSSTGQRNPSTAAPRGGDASHRARAHRRVGPASRRWRSHG